MSAFAYGQQPGITVQPRSQAVRVGTNLNFNVVATGATPLSYQWRKNGSGLLTKTNNALTLSNAQAADAAAYTVVVSNSLGSVTSAPAYLRVADPATAYTTPFRPGHLAEGLVGWWKLDEASGPRADSSGRGNHLTDNNTVGSVVEDYWGTGERSADFESTASHYLSIADAAQTGLSLTSSYTFCAWIRMESINDFMPIAGKTIGANGYAFLIRTTGDLGVSHGGGVANFSAGLAVGVWQHVALVYDDGSDRLVCFVNGALVGVASVTTSPPASSDFFGLGKHNADAIHYDGLMKDAAMWGRALTSLEVKSLALGVDLEVLSFRPGNVSVPPTAWWKMNEASSGAATVTRLDSAVGHHLTDNNTVSSSGGFVEGTAARFASANSESFSVSNNPAFDFGSGDFAFSTWARFDAGPDVGRALCGKISGTSGWLWLIAPVGKTMYLLDSGISSVSVAIPTIASGTWYHLAVVRSGPTIRFFVDGKQAGATQPAAATYNGVAGPLTIGQYDGVAFFDGFMQDMAIWKGYALTDFEIKALATGLPLQQSGIVSYWPLDESSGTRTDRVGANHLTDNNTVGSASGVVGNAASFARVSSESLSIADAAQSGLDLTNCLSAFAWVKPATTGFDTYPVSKNALVPAGPGYAIKQRFDMLTGIHVEDTTAATVSTVTSGQWSFIGGTFDAVAKRSYFNSVFERILESPYAPVNTALPFTIGAENPTANFYDGLIDEVVVARRAFREEEIKTIYNRGLNGLPIIPTVPFINVQPQSITVAFGSNATFSVQAGGQEPLSYFWFRNGTFRGNAVNAVFVLSNAQPANAGNYTVVITNSLGSVTSQVATLTVETTFTEVSAAAGLAVANSSSSGAAWGDFNNDGFLDLVLASVGEELLYRNNGNGSFTRITNSPVTAAAINTIGVNWGDYDNDGWLDLFVVNLDVPCVLFRNNGDGSFSETTGAQIVPPPVGSRSAAWTDFDGDGWLDLFVAIGGTAQNPNNALYRNNRNGTFSPVTNSVVTSDGTESPGCAWGDFNGDGLPDLIVAALGPNLFYANNGAGNFTRITNGAVATDHTSIAPTWGDYDNDGDLDLFVSNFSGNPNSLFRNEGGTNFTDVSLASGVEVELGNNYSYSSAWADFDNDGWLDLIVATVGTNQFFHNRGDGTFSRIATGSIAASTGAFVGVAWGDYDNDGFPDLILTGATNSNRLYHNDGNSNAWLKVRCRGVVSNRSAIGAKVRVLASIGGTNRWQLREVSGGQGYGCQNSLEQIFGLGDATNIIALRVEWPSGKRTELYNISPRQTLDVSEPVEVYAAANGRGTVTISPATNQYFIGQTLTLTATPRNTNWTRFLRWSDGNPNATRNYLVSSTNVVTAIFTNFVTLEELAFQEWDKSFGGTNTDDLRVARSLPDGRFVFGGHSSSPPGISKTSPNYGSNDFWIVCVDADGNRLWDRSFGGTNDDQLTALLPLSDGGFIVGGYSASPPGGNKTSPNFGDYDFWVLRLNSGGDKLWETNYGGSGEDHLRDIQPTSDGGFILAGESVSNASGNKGLNGFGEGDGWVIRIDGNGSKQWERVFGGTNSDRFVSAGATLDGGFLIGGDSISPPSGNKTSTNYGGFDFWVLKLDSHGNKLWETNYGGTGTEQFRSLELAGDGGCILAGWSGSGISGNKTLATFLGADAWVVKLDAFGAKQWEQVLGGTNFDSASAVRQLPDGGVRVACLSDSDRSGNKTTPNPNTPDYDYWLVRLQPDGTKLSEFQYGGTNRPPAYSGLEADDYLNSVALTSNGCLIAGSSLSLPSGNKTATNFGGADFWAVKLITREAPVGTPLILVNGQYSSSSYFVLTTTNDIQVELKTSLTNSIILYSIGGGTPDTYYDAPFLILDSAVIRAVALDLGTSLYSAEPEPVTIIGVPIYSLAATTPGGGTISLDPPGGSYTSNTMVTLTATQTNNWQFMFWTGDIGWDPLESTCRHASLSIL